MTKINSLNIERIYPLKPQPNIHNILVIGCGGTGSYIVPNLVRLAVNGKHPVCITLADADIVEHKNLIRQNFIKSDIGRNKAEVLASRYSAAFGTQLQFIPKYLETAEAIGTALSKAQINNISYGKATPLIISCVDNIKSRKKMIEALTLHYPRGAYIIDCGNEEMTGQVLLTCLTTTNTPAAGLYSTPHLFQLFPELNEREKNDKLASELSCAELAESSEQFGFVNLNAATIALNFIHMLLNRSHISTYMTEFSIENKFSQRSLKESALKSWASFGLNPDIATVK
jgi:PRTRC genetic system ThiF family protein